MSESLFAQLKKLGIDEELASQVSASLDPDHNASKRDVLIMQEAILQLQARTDDRHNQFIKDLAASQAKSDDRHSQFIKEMTDLQAKTDERYYELKMEIKDVRSELKTEIHTTINRQYLVTFGSALLTIASVLAVNWYYHFHL